MGFLRLETGFRNRDSVLRIRGDGTAHAARAVASMARNISCGEKTIGGIHYVFFSFIL